MESVIKYISFCRAGLSLLLNIIHIRSSRLCLFSLNPLPDKGPEQTQNGDNQEHAGGGSHEEIAKTVFRIGKPLSQIALQHGAENKTEKERRPVQPGK